MNKARVVSIVATFILLLMVIPVAASANDSTQPVPIVKCTPVVDAHVVIIRCTAADIVVLDTTVNIPTVTLSPIPGPTKTIGVPGPTKTVHVPGPTSTVAQQVPGATKTVTEPGSTKTETNRVTVSSLPKPVQTKTETVTKTVTSSPTRQPVSPSDTVAPSNDPQAGGIPRVFFSTPAKIIGISTLTVLLLGLLGLLALWLGYVLGYRDSDRENANFMAALSDRMLVRGKHE